MSTIHQLVEQAKDLMQDQKYDEAVQVLQSCLEHEPDNEWVWYQLSMVYYVQGEIIKSEGAIQNACSIQPDNIDYNLQLAHLKYLLDDPDAAEMLCNRILDEDPTHAEAYMLLGRLARDQQNLKDAITYLEAAAADEQNCTALALLIETYMDVDELDMAAQKLRVYTNLELDEIQKQEGRNLLLRYFLLHAIESWTGVENGENGEENYFPESLQQLEAAEEDLENARNIETDSPHFKEHIELLEGVIENYKPGLLGHTNCEPQMECSNGDLEPEEQIEAPAEEEDNATQSLNGVDEQAWELLESIYYSWTQISEEAGVEYRSPNTVSELKSSRKLFRQVKQLKSSDPDIKKRYKELAAVWSEARKQMPNYSVRFFRSLLISIAVLAGFLIFFQIKDFKAEAIDYLPQDWLVAEDTELVYDAFVGEMGQELKHFRRLRRGTQLKPLARMGRSWIQVETEQGEKGFVYFRKLSGARQAVLNRDAPLYQDYSHRQFADSLQKGNPVVVLTYLKEGNELHGNLAKVRNAALGEGILPYYQLDLPFMEKLPCISETYLFPTTKQNITRLIGNATLSELEERYGPVSSLIAKGKNRMAYFRQVNFIDGDEKQRGLFAVLDQDNKLIDFQMNTVKEVGFMSRLPFSEFLREVEPSRYFGLAYYQSDMQEFAWWANFKDYHWSTKVLGWVIQVAIMLILGLLLFSVPRLLIQPIMVLVGYCRILGNGMVRFLNLMIYAAVSYLFLVWMMLLMDQWFAPLLFAVPAFILWAWVYRKQFDYKR